MTQFKIGDAVRSLRPHDSRTGEVFDILWLHPSRFSNDLPMQRRIRVKWNVTGRTVRTWFMPYNLGLVNKTSTI